MFPQKGHKNGKILKHELPSPRVHPSLLFLFLKTLSLLGFYPGGICPYLNVSHKLERTSLSTDMRLRGVRNAQGKKFLVATKFLIILISNEDIDLSPSIKVLV